MSREIRRVAANWNRQGYVTPVYKYGILEMIEPLDHGDAGDPEIAADYADEIEEMGASADGSGEVTP